MPSGDNQGGEVSDSTGSFRYAWWECWDPVKPRVLFVMLNPATVDEARQRRHPTRAKCIELAKKYQFGTLLEGNLYGWRSTNPRDLLSLRDPVGALNDECVSKMLGLTNTTVVAWGNGVPRSDFAEREHEMLDLIREKVGIEQVFCLGNTKKGHPCHPNPRRPLQREVEFVRFFREPKS